MLHKYTQDHELSTFYFPHPPKVKVLLGYHVRIGRHVGIVRAIGFVGRALAVTLELC